MAHALTGSHIADDPELLLRRLTAYSLDYNLLTNDIFGWTPRTFQARILLNPDRNHILNTARQVGKSEAVCALAAAVTLSPLKANSTSLVVSASRDQASDLLRRISHNLKAAQDAGLCRITELSKHHVVLQDGSRVFSVASTPTSTRGYSVSGVLIIDEAAFVESQIFTAVLATTAAAGGSTQILSTPCGKSGTYSDIFHSDDPSWTRITFLADDPECPLDKNYLEQQRRILGPSRYAQEYMGSFMEHDLSAYSYQNIEQAFSGASGQPWEQEQDKIIHTDNPFAGAF